MSVSGSVARRYARALLEIGLETKRLRPLVEEVDRVAGAVDESSELRDVLLNPMVLKSQRKKVLDALTRRLGVTAAVRNTCMILVDRGRADILPAIARELRRMVDEHDGNVRAEVTSSTPLTRIYTDRLTKALEGATGKKVMLTAKQDESLIGGVVTRVGGVVYDGSLKTRLSRVREEMLR